MTLPEGFPHRYSIAPRHNIPAPAAAKIPLQVCFASFDRLLMRYPYQRVPLVRDGDDATLMPMIASFSHSLYPLTIHRT